MRFNERDLASVAVPPGDIEGRLSHKPPRSGLREERPRERWFKLKNNLLFYFRLNEHGGVSSDQPAGLFILENCHIQPEPDTDDLLYCFSIALNHEFDRRHLFSCVSEAAMNQWVAALRGASYDAQRRQLKELRNKVMNLTGTDPVRQISGGRALKNLNSTEDEVRESVTQRHAGRVSAKQPTFFSHLVPGGGQNCQLSSNGASLLD